MRFGAYAWMTISFCIVFYMLGFQSPLMSILVKQGSATCTDPAVPATCTTGQPMELTSLIKAIGQELMNQSRFMDLLVITAVGVVVSLLTGFSATFVAPILILLVFMNYVIFPISFIFEGIGDPIANTILLVIINTFGVMAVISFIRGGI